jgi:hypothetical protein
MTLSASPTMMSPGITVNHSSRAPRILTSVCEAVTRHLPQRVEYVGDEGRTGQFEWLEGGLHVGSFSLE